MSEFNKPPPDDTGEGEDFIVMRLEHVRANVREIMENEGYLDVVKEKKAPEAYLDKYAIEFREEMLAARQLRAEIAAARLAAQVGTGNEEDNDPPAPRCGAASGNAGDPTPPERGTSSNSDESLTGDIEEVDVGDAAELYKEAMEGELGEESDAEWQGDLDALEEDADDGEIEDLA